MLLSMTSMLVYKLLAFQVIRTEEGQLRVWQRENMLRGDITGVLRCSLLLAILQACESITGERLLSLE